MSEVRSALIIFALSAIPAGAQADTWVVLPAYAANPPPRDPTLLRLTKTIAEALHQSSQEDVRVVTRELRDEACPGDDGRCPRDL